MAVVKAWRESAGMAIIWGGADGCDDWGSVGAGIMAPMVVTPEVGAIGGVAGLVVGVTTDAGTLVDGRIGCEKVPVVAIVSDTRLVWRRDRRL